MFDHRRRSLNGEIKIVRESASLFVDNVWIAQGLLGVVVLAAIVSEAAPNLLTTALVLLLGFLGKNLIDIASPTVGASRHDASQ
jgi:hypothetical protein